MASRRLLTVLAALAAVRVGIAVAAAAAEGTKLPGLPTYRWRGLEGDANGYYAAAREVLAASRSPVVATPAVLALALGVGAAWLLRRRGRPVSLQVLAGGAGIAGCATAVTAGMEPSGAPVVGWPLLWAVPLAPLRIFGEPSIDAAWTAGVALSLACVAIATVACGLLGRWATGSDAVGIGAAALFTAWPLVVGTLAGRQAWENGTWLADAGLHLYTEPLSTAVVVSALAVLVRPAAGSASSATAGLLLGFATAVKLTNGVIGLVLVPLVARRHGVRAAALYAAGGLLFAPLVAVYWDKGYVANYGDISASDEPWGIGYAADNWTDSLLFTPTLLGLLAPLAIVGSISVRDRWAVGVLLAVIGATALTYTVYDLTALHPRFLFVALPSLFVLEAAGAHAVVAWLQRRVPRPARQASQ